ncbi:MAG: type II toxin-antitoxin system Phd/YefM family antitoxin [Planctomycetaceae bacterium]|nr:type II toxin-antitoxin system Phd/YefM family antitoxin [Planctomycetaceae bacterium]
MSRVARTDEPLVLTVNGKAEVVVQDATAYQRLLDLAARADREEAVAAIREGLADAEAGRVKPARKALKALARKYGIPAADE